jgi:predicted nuclease of predicted toxin-antitoxin system
VTAPDPFRVLLDASVPDSVGKVLARRGCEVILHRDVLPDATPDEVVCATALKNDAILAALDNDMKRIAERYGANPGNTRFARLHLIRIGCNGILGAQRVDQAMTLIEHEWAFTKAKVAQRMWIDIEPHSFRTHR